MIRTQIYMPDRLYSEARAFAEYQETSLAELVRRGLEMLLRTTAPAAARAADHAAWTPPVIRPLGVREDPFADENWRLDINMREPCVAEDDAEGYAPRRAGR